MLTIIFLEDVAKNISSFLTFPIVILIIVLIFVYSDKFKEQISSVAARVTSIRAFGVQVAWNEEAAKTLDETIKLAATKYRNLAQAYIDDAFKEKRIVFRLRDAVNSGLCKAFEKIGHDVSGVPEKGIPGFRCALYIQDLVFKDCLLQATDYFPHGGETRKRFKSVRYGAIGKCWRTRDHLYDGDVLGSTGDDEMYITQWGLTWQDVEEMRKKSKSVACVVLKSDDDTDPLAVIFMDAPDQHAFGNDKNKDNNKKIAKEIGRHITQCAKDNGLLGDLQEIDGETSKLRLTVDIG